MAGSSETNPGGGNGAGGTNGHNDGTKGPVRNMADITRLFMNGARSNAARPQRIPPGGAGGTAPIAKSPKPEFTDPRSKPTQAAPVPPQRTEPVPHAPSNGISNPAEPGPHLLPRPTLHELVGGSLTGTPGDAVHAKPVEELSPLPAAVVALTFSPSDAPGLTGAFDGVVAAAKALSEVHGVAIGIIARDGELLHVGRVAQIGKTWDGRNTCVGVALAPASEVAVARSLYRLREHVDHWIIGLPGDPSSQPAESRHAAGQPALERRLLEASNHWVIVSGMENDAVIACYRRLKSACGSVEAGERRIQLMLQPGHAGSEAAARVHARLNQVARDFLGQELMLTILHDDHAPATFAEAVATFDLAEAADREVAGVWESVIDFVHDLTGGADDAEEGPAAAADMEEEDLGRVLEEGEREALLPEQNAVSESRDQTIVPSALPIDTPAPIASPLPVVPMEPTLDHVHTFQEPCLESAVTATSAASTPDSAPFTPVPAPLASQSATALSICDATGWPAIEQAAVAILPAAIVLEARPPMAPHALLMAEPAGRIHVWCMIDAANPLAWMAVWAWAREHRELIALTRRDLAIDPRADLAVHVVSPDGPPAIIGGLTAPAGVQWYRMHPVRWGDKTGTLIIPN